jgi:SAM-dependent methyltransferase
MAKAKDILKFTLSLGSEPQNFLGAKWIVPFLRRVPASKKRKWALRILNLSPHYFIDGDNPEFKDMSLDEYLEKSFEIIAATRDKLYETLFREHLKPEFDILEYGCGPGFVAKAVSPYVRTMNACDISPGVLACAAIVNQADNINYLRADEEGLAAIADGSLDAVISFAVIQHVTNEVFEMILENCRCKLKTGGRVILHIQLADETWKSEDEWKADGSLKGRLKYKYGLHCFGRTLAEHEEFLKRHGFSVVATKDLSTLNEAGPNDFESQYLLVGEKLPKK